LFFNGENDDVYFIFPFANHKYPIYTIGWKHNKVDKWCSLVVYLWSKWWITKNPIIELL
jgi:hypothetical protein